MPEPALKRSNNASFKQTYTQNLCFGFKMALG